MPTLNRSDYEHTLEEVAQELGVSRERVRQIESEALGKLRIAMEAKGLAPTELDKEPSGPGLFDVKTVLPY